MIDLVAIGVGTAFNMFAAAKEGEDLAAQAQANAELKRLQANEVLERSEMNVAALVREIQGINAQQTAATAKAGGGKANLVVLEATNVMGARAIQNVRREARFKADMLQRGADLEEIEANDARNAAYLKVFGTALGGAGTILGRAKVSTPMTTDTSISESSTGSLSAGGQGMFLTDEV